MTSARDPRVGLVTGGATGIGRATCEALASAGVGTVVIGYSRSADEAQELAAFLETTGTRAVAMQVDVSSETSVIRLMDRVTADLGRLDYVVNCAGMTRLIPLGELDAVTDDDWNQILRVNLLGAFWCSRAAHSLLRESRGSIVNVASIAGYRAVGSSIPYGVSKAGVLQLTRSLAVSMAPEVRVNSVSAGTVQSGWHEKLVGVDVFAPRAEAEAEVVPLKRLAQPEDIAAAIVSLLLLDFVTGQDLLVDGGKGLLY